VLGGVSLGKSEKRVGLGKMGGKKK